MGRLGDWLRSKCKCNCFAAFSSKTKSLTLICISGDTTVYISEEISTSVLLSRYVCSGVYQDKSVVCFSIKLEQQSGLIFFFQNALRQNILLYYVIELAKQNVLV